MNTSDNSPPVGIPPPEYRLPAATRLGRVRLQVADLARSIAFYEDLIGLRVLDAPDECAVLGAQGDDTPLVELVEQPGTRPVPRRGRLGLYHVAFLLPERAALGRFVRHLAEAYIQSSGMSDHRVSEAVYLRDPDGLGIEVYADRPRAKWSCDADGQIAMTTEPLDLGPLVEAAGDVPWTGAPAGTAVGHVHLHVGDLDRAAVFYHEALGFDKTVWSYPGALFLSAGGYHHHLGTNTWAGDAPPADPDDARLLEWTLVLPAPGDVDAVLRSLKSAGYAASRNERGGRVTDPWGTVLRLTTAR